MQPNVSNLVKITDEDFIHRIIIDKADALVKFCPDWNAAGKLLFRSLENLAFQHRDKLKFYQVDFSHESSLCSTYRIQGVPTILFFKKGTLVDKLCGLVKPDAISKKISQHLLTV
jgi:thioredoxin 1